MAGLFCFPPLHFNAPILPHNGITRPNDPIIYHPFPFATHPQVVTRKDHELTRTRALREWQEYEEAVKHKDLAKALRFLKDIPIESENSTIESTQLSSGELGLFGSDRDWEVLDTCLNADDMRLVGSAYAFLKDRGFLPNFGKFRNIVLEGPREVTPTVLKTSTGLEVSKFSPKKWGVSGSSSVVSILLFAGVSLLLNQGIDIRPNLAAVLGLAMLDAIFLGGSCLAQISSYWPPYKRRILVHEAGHLLVAYLMGCPIRGVILDPIVAMQMGIQGQAGTQFWDEKLQNELAEGRVSGTAFDRYCMVLFAGIAAEALVYEDAEGGENDENLFRSICVLLEPPLSVAQSLDLVQLQFRSHSTYALQLNGHSQNFSTAGMSSWRNLVLRIGEKCPDYGGNDDFKDHIETCFGAVRRELEYSEDDILVFLLQCAEQLPHKIPLYGTLVGLLNLENEDFVTKVVENTQANLQAALDSGKCDRIRVLMRFLTGLMCSKVLQPSSLVVLFETLLSSAATTVDDDKGNPSWQARADFYITCILSCLPWGGGELVEQVPEEIERVMAGIQAYMSIRRHVSDTGFSVFEDIDESNQSDNEKDFLEDLWSRIQDLSNNGWKLDSVPRPHLSFEAQLVAGKSHDFGPISCPDQSDPPTALSGIAFGRQKHEAESKYPQRIRRLNIFPSSKYEDVQPIDRFVVEEYLLDVMMFLNGCRKECASCMVGLPVSFRYEYLMAETIFSQLLLLPQPPFKPMYYTLVIIDLCKALPGAFPSVVAGAVRALFDRIADLDMECRTRLILWFSHHLSNFQFIWPWEEWAYVLDLPKWAPQRVFVQEILEREVRLSYWDKIKQSIESAPALEELLPPKGTPNFKYSSEDGGKTEHALSSELIGMVKGRLSSREIVSWVEDSVLAIHGLDIVLGVVVQTLLNIGSKSFTHLITVLERYGQVISRICSDQDKQVMLISEVSSFWKNNAQMTAIAIDRMMGYRLISNLAILRWVFSPSNVDQFHISDRPWEILRNAVNKTYNRISDLRKEMSSLKKSILSAEESASKARAELSAAESKLTLMDGEPVLGENPVRMKRLKSQADKANEEELSVRESLEAKEALFAQAVDEIEALFISLYKSFSNVLVEPLRDAFKDGMLRRTDAVDEMPIDDEDSSAMELDKESGKSKKSHFNGDRSGNDYTVGEKEQWCLSTLGYVKAFTRQYASEIWPHVEKLDAEVLTKDVHPLFLKAFYSGLRRPMSDLV